MSSLKKKTTNNNEVLTKWEQFVLTLVRTRKGFDVKFLADTFEINSSQVSKIYNTWIAFLSQELSFLVPWPSRSELRKSLPQRFKRFQNVRIMLDCLELFIQKPKVPISQKITWSSYKHWNTFKLLVGITPTGVISFVPPLWTGAIKWQGYCEAKWTAELAWGGARSHGWQGLYYYYYYCYCNCYYYYYCYYFYYYYYYYKLSK